MNGAPLNPHVCNAFCAPPEHCELVYVGRADEVSETEARGQVVNAYWRQLGVRVERIEEAAEAPPLDVLARQPGVGLEALCGMGGRDGWRWLVYWSTCDRSRIPSHAAPTPEIGGVSPEPASRGWSETDHG